MGSTLIHAKNPDHSFSLVTTLWSRGPTRTRQTVAIMLKTIRTGRELLPFSRPSIGEEEIARIARNHSYVRDNAPFQNHAEIKKDSAARRAFDIACAAVGLILLAPLFAIIAAAIKLEDRGPVFFIQTRVGKGFKNFRLFKFRSMAADSPESAPLAGPRDPRITTVGRFLRKHKLDELPQLIHVVKGEMQLVGVRPQLERFVQIFPDEYSILLQDRPGITDLASLTYRNEEQLFKPGPLDEQYVAQILPEKLKLSLKYHRARTFFPILEFFSEP